jgi:purine-cytosine permease-like protein
MNLEELKSSWKLLDQKLATTQQLTEQMALSMMKDRSRSTVSKISNKLKILAFYFAGLFGLFIAILMGNPFDYNTWYQYVPAATYALLVTAGFEIIIREIIAINNIGLSKNNLRENLQKIIQLQEKYESVMLTVWKISMAIGYLFGISLLVRNFGTYGWLKSIWITAAYTIFAVLTYLIVRRFYKKIPDKNLEDLKINLSELEE